MRSTHRLALCCALLGAVSSVFADQAAQSPLQPSYPRVPEPPEVTTTSGIYTGFTNEDGVAVFQGIRFAHPPTGDRRWAKPEAFVSNDSFDAINYGPACYQQFAYPGILLRKLFNDPAPESEDEDCLFLNVWAPPKSNTPKAVLVWIYGGAFAFGTASIPGYDGSSLATNQDIVVVTLNYRTNVFGFVGGNPYSNPGIVDKNLGFLDQDLALKWVKDNIAEFGGDKDKITINGESAGAMSVAWILQRSKDLGLFRAAILQSGAAMSAMVPPANTNAFPTFRDAMDCNKGLNTTATLECLRKKSAPEIFEYINGPDAPHFTPAYDGKTVFTSPLTRIRNGNTAQVPILIGANQDDGSLFRGGAEDVTEWVQSNFKGLVKPETVKTIYNYNNNDIDVINAAIRDVAFLCPGGITANAFVNKSVNVYRYEFGAEFSNDPLPDLDLGAWHSSEVLLVFGTHTDNRKDELSRTLQRIWGNFVKNPNASPAPNWQPYTTTSATGLAKLAYNGNFGYDDIVEAVKGDENDAPCTGLWKNLYLG